MGVHAGGSLAGNDSTPASSITSSDAVGSGAAGPSTVPLARRELCLVVASKVVMAVPLDGWVVHFFRPQPGCRACRIFDPAAALPAWPTPKHPFQAAATVAKHP